MSFPPGLTLGISSGSLSTSASSVFSPSYTATKAVINANSAWISNTAESNSNTSFIVAESTELMEIHGVQLQGRGDSTLQQWVTSYTLKYTIDGTTWLDYDGGAVQTGSTDKNTIVTNVFPKPIRAKSIALYPKSCFGHTSMRWEVHYKLLPPTTVGCYDCGTQDIKDPNGNKGPAMVDFSIKFQSAFTKPPFVLVALRKFTIQTASGYASMYVEARNVTETGFDLHFEAFDQCNLGNGAADWVAFEPK